jgi:2-polyprenyl-6-methoxyphenol hydroxylase-like FAD-dependent oxidoreductase
MRVLISGGGIAGLTLAYWLHRYGIETVVSEKAASLHRASHGLDFFGTGYDVAERMGLIDQLRERRLPFEDVAYVDASGKCVAHLSIDLMNRIMQNRYMALMRSTLVDVLYEATASAVEVRSGTTLAAVSPGSNEVAVTFNDGTTDSFDLLIGADGVHSNVRRLVFGEDARFERYLGYYFASYYLVDRYGIGHAWKNYNEPGRMASAYPGNKDGELVTFFMYKTAHEGHIPREQRLQRLRRAFAGMGWITQQLLEDVSDPNGILLDSLTQIDMPRWHQGRVALVGDACGCPTLLSGQGASMAMGGAYILAEALHTASDYASAFQRYEQQVRPHVERLQKAARSFGKVFLPESELGVTIQRLTYKLLLRDSWRGLLRQQFGVESLLPPQEVLQGEPSLR